MGNGEPWGMLVVCWKKKEKNLTIVIMEIQSCINLKNIKFKKPGWKEGHDYYTRMTLLPMWHVQNTNVVKSLSAWGFSLAPFEYQVNFRFLNRAHKDSVNRPVPMFLDSSFTTLSQRLSSPATPKLLLFPKQVMCFIAFLDLNILFHLLAMLFFLLCLEIPTDTSRVISLLFINKPPSSFPWLAPSPVVISSQSIHGNCWPLLCPIFLKWFESF